MIILTTNASGIFITHAGICMAVPLCETLEAISEEAVIADALVGQVFFVVLTGRVAAAVVERVATDGLHPALRDAVAHVSRLARAVEGLDLFVEETLGVFDAPTSAAGALGGNALMLGVSDVTWKSICRLMESLVYH